MKLIKGRRLLMSLLYGFFVLVWGMPCQAEELNIKSLFDPTRLVEIEIKMDPSDWSELSSQSRDPSTAFNGMPNINPFTYFKADLWVDGKMIESIGVRKKGFFGSADVQRPSLKIKFDKYKKQKPIPGITRLTLNNNKQDKSLCSQLLCYQLYRDAGNHAPLSNLAHVTVNGESLGIYSNVESIGKPFLKSRFGDKSGNLYEGTLTDFYIKSLPKMEKKTNKKDNDSVSLNKFAKLVGAQGKIDLEELESQLNVEAFYRYWAIESLTGFWDGYANNQNNYFVYFDPKDDMRAYFIPWGADWVFTESGPFGMSNGGATTVYAQSLLTNRLIKSETGSKCYRKAMIEVLENAWDEKKMISTVDSVEKLVKSKLHSAQSDVGRSMDQVRDFIRKRRKTISDSLADWSPNIPRVPRKPAYMVEVGTAKGNFSTTFAEGRNSAKSITELAVSRDQKELSIESTTTSVKLSPPPRFGFGGFGRPVGESQPKPDPKKQPISLVIMGRQENGGLATITLTIPRMLYNKANDGEPIEVTGFYNQSGNNSNRGFGGFGGTRLSIIGRLRLIKTGQKPGEEVAGEFDLSVVESRGGFASRNGQRGPRPGGGMRRPTQMSISDALDENKDGKISADEIDNAAKSLRLLDRNKDGVLSADEIRKSTVSNRRFQIEN